MNCHHYRISIPTPQSEVLRSRKGPNSPGSSFDIASLQRQPGTNCIKIGLPGKLILSKRMGFPEDLFSNCVSVFPESLFVYTCPQYCLCGNFNLIVIFAFLTWSTDPPNPIQPTKPMSLCLARLESVSIWWGWGCLAIKPSGLQREIYRLCNWSNNSGQSHRNLSSWMRHESVFGKAYSQKNYGKSDSLRCQNLFSYHYRVHGQTYSPRKWFPEATFL